jgi:hypothetical protein
MRIICWFTAGVRLLGFVRRKKFNEESKKRHLHTKSQAHEVAQRNMLFLVMLFLVSLCALSGFVRRKKFNKESKKRHLHTKSPGTRSCIKKYAFPGDALLGEPLCS